mmetsp:Transcript_17258/g.38040  ORF Transcript_17258/g.38040 Transcript_17258/m.38040 type:complete len:151 (+) Transcript_17258:172-624(+)
MERPLFESFSAAFFLGGDERIKLITDWMKAETSKGNVFAVVTAGQASAVTYVLQLAVPEWIPYLPSGRVWDSQQSRHAVGAVILHKLMILRDICPDAKVVVLVDDALAKEDVSPQWLGATGAVCYNGLQYEDCGLTAEHCQKVSELVAAA